MNSLEKGGRYMRYTTGPGDKGHTPDSVGGEDKGARGGGGMDTGHNHPINKGIQF